MALTTNLSSTIARLRRGLFDEDAPDPSFNFRAAVKECIAAKEPIFPNRKLDLEFAAEGGINAVRTLPLMPG